MRPPAQRCFVLLLVLLPTLGCDPRDPCDPGQYADHGACYPRLPGLDAGGSDAASADGAAKNPGATFGTPCTTHAQCGEDAPNCGAPMLSYCTAVNCMSGAATCPADWECFDIRGLSPLPEVTSICLRI